MTKAPSIYLAGPEVFLPNAKEVLMQKSEIAREFGFTPIAPGDAQVPVCETRFQHGAAISAYDEKLMLQSDTIVANLTPFRGTGADPGTCFELGFMCALGRQVGAYTNDARSYVQRVTQATGDGVVRDEAGKARTASDGMLVEEFDMIDNLMMHGGIANRGGPVEVHQAAESQMFSDMSAFRRVLERMAKSC